MLEVLDDPARDSINNYRQVFIWTHNKSVCFSSGTPPCCLVPAVVLSLANLCHVQELGYLAAAWDSVTVRVLVCALCLAVLSKILQEMCYLQNLLPYLFRVLVILKTFSLVCIPNAVKYNRYTSWSTQKMILHVLYLKASHQLSHRALKAPEVIAHRHEYFMEANLPISLPTCVHLFARLPRPPLRSSVESPVCWYADAT